jgi:hypothetical protein
VQKSEQQHKHLQLERIRRQAVVGQHAKHLVKVVGDFEVDLLQKPKLNKQKNESKTPHSKNLQHSGELLKQLQQQQLCFARRAHSMVQTGLHQAVSQ